MDLVTAIQMLRRGVGDTGRLLKILEHDLYAAYRLGVLPDEIARYIARRELEAAQFAVKLMERGLREPIDAAATVLTAVDYGWSFRKVGIAPAELGAALILGYYALR